MTSSLCSPIRTQGTARYPLAEPVHLPVVAPAAADVLERARVSHRATRAPLHQAPAAVPVQPAQAHAGGHGQAATRGGAEGQQQEEQGQQEATHCHACCSRHTQAAHRQHPGHM